MMGNQYSSRRSANENNANQLARVSRTTTAAASSNTCSFSACEPVQLIVFRRPLPPLTALECLELKRVLEGATAEADRMAELLVRLMTDSWCTEESLARGKQFVAQCPGSCVFHGKLAPCCTLSQHYALAPYTDVAFCAVKSALARQYPSLSWTLSTFWVRVGADRGRVCVALLVNSVAPRQKSKTDEHKPEPKPEHKRVDTSSIWYSPPLPRAADCKAEKQARARAYARIKLQALAVGVGGAAAGVGNWSGRQAWRRSSSSTRR